MQVCIDGTLSSLLSMNAEWWIFSMQNLQRHCNRWWWKPNDCDHSIMLLLLKLLI